MHIRRAKLSDAQVCAGLIFDSGPNSLSAMFDVSEQHSAREFLRFAFSHAYGQFGFTSHLVVEKSQQPIAVGSCWTDNPTQSFRNATLKSLIEFFGMDATQDVIARSQNLAAIIPSPTSDELGIGHIATVFEAREKGAASLLLRHFSELAKKLGKNALVLDVEASNQTAIRLYEHVGFKITANNKPDAQGEALGLTEHCHMQLLL